MNKYDDYLVKCPYYRRDSPLVLFCEGLEDGMAIHLAFATRQQLKNWKRRYCRQCEYSNCPIAKLLNLKWGCEDE